jgi:polysaccharide deacetylase 2 family uncharacterized protein YibQ
MAFGFGAKTARLRDPRKRNGWRNLGFFWLAVLLVLGAGGGVVQFLGPPGAPAPAPSRPPVPLEAASGSVPSVEEHKAAGVAPAPLPAGRVPGSIAPPEAAMLELAAAGSAERLPRIAADGRTPRQVYAAPFDSTSHLPRIGLLVAGLGLNQAESDAAVQSLPGGVSLAVSPYSTNPAKLLAAARAAGHEYLLAIPLEPTGFPLNDPGPATLLTSASEAVNAVNLRWSLSRMEGYAGVTGVIGTMRGERMAAIADRMDPVLTEIAHRGLFYIDPRVGRGPLPKVWGRHVDVVIDDPADRESIDARLAELEQLAKDRGTALGLVMRPTPVAVARIAAWTNGLADRGMTLAPASALAVAPVDAPVKLSEGVH